jgi:hypothetical protein
MSNHSHFAASVAKHFVEYAQILIHLSHPSKALRILLLYSCFLENKGLFSWPKLGNATRQGFFLSLEELSQIGFCSRITVLKTEPSVRDA